MFRPSTGPLTISETTVMADVSKSRQIPEIARALQKMEIDMRSTFHVSMLTSWLLESQDEQQVEPISTLSSKVPYCYLA